MRRRKRSLMAALGLAGVLGAGIWTLAGHLQARVGEVRQHRDAQGMPLLEFQALYEKGRALVVDVRDRGSFEAGRIAGAMHVPVDDFESAGSGAGQVRRRAQGRLVVTYCSCPTEASSLRAARLLSAAGVPARALIGGYPKWVEAGGRVERGAPPH